MLLIVYELGQIISPPKALVFSHVKEFELDDHKALSVT